MVKNQLKAKKIEVYPDNTNQILYGYEIVGKVY